MPGEMSFLVLKIDVGQAFLSSMTFCAERSAVTLESLTCITPTSPARAV
jgi:hypothetical protein